MASFHPSPAEPRLRLPRGACDTHFHVFGPRHPNLKEVPDDGLMLDLIAEIAPGEALLVDNPRRFYGFEH